MVHLVPVAVIVLGVEAGDAQRGGVGDGATELVGVDPGDDGLVDGADDLGRLLGQERPRQLGDAAVVVESVASGCGESLGQRGGRRGDHAGEVVGEPPRPALLAATGRGGLGHQRRQDVGRRSHPRCSSTSNALLVKSMVWPPSRKTWSVTAANMMSATVVASTCGDGRCQGALGGVGRAGLDEPPVPAARADRRAAHRRAGAAGTAAPDRGCRGTRTPGRGPAPDAWSAGSRWGSTLAIDVSTVSPAPHPASR